MTTSRRQPQAERVRRAQRNERDNMTHDRDYCDLGEVEMAQTAAHPRTHDTQRSN